jgi:hypothetical protein
MCDQASIKPLALSENLD